MRYELSLKAVEEEKEAAKLGLNVVSKLTPQMTAYQKQVQSEGIDPRSPAGILRVKELLAVDKATPEMKAYAAQAGISLTDPQFAMKFKMYEDTKGLRDIATRLNLNLNDPAQLATAQQEAQREKFRAENKLVADALQTFGATRSIRRTSSVPKASWTRMCVWTKLASAPRSRHKSRRPPGPSKKSTTIFAMATSTR
jgi:hypothetical protein